MQTHVSSNVYRRRRRRRRETAASSCPAFMYAMLQWFGSHVCMYVCTCAMNTIYIYICIRFGESEGLLLPSIGYIFI